MVDHEIGDQVLRPGQEPRLRQATAGPLEQVRRRPPFLDEHDLLALVLVEAPGQLRVDEAGLLLQLLQLSSQEIIEQSDVLRRDVGGQDSYDHPSRMSVERRDTHATNGPGHSNFATVLVRSGRVSLMRAATPDSIGIGAIAGSYH